MFGRNSYTLSKENKSRKLNVIKYLEAPSGMVGNILSWVLFTLVFWGALYSITGGAALPKGNLFSLLVLIILAQLGGILAEKARLPPLLGMLIVGVILRSVPYIDIIGSNIDSSWSSAIRKMALVVILTRAGLGLDPKALQKLSFTVIRLGILPNLVEMHVVAVVSHFLLEFPWLWSFMLGFIFSGVSPSVVVPCMLNLADRRLGTDKGVPTLIIAGLSIDNALSISGIGVFMGVIFSSGGIVWQAFKGPVEVLAGIVWGIIIGIICWTLNFGGAGAMGCLTTAFVAGIGWRNQGWPDNKHPVKKNFNFLWCFYQPLLFGLIGTEIKVIHILAYVARE
ncbi:Mitochondrial sodium/hydrogen exchanger 9B2 [Armadillidium nasatum]|uniref:Mitochondrial sodium/hydrogen exchanger 9B2 n=1 Tax=Armadillidium nasatum TaxID=96803 RepID=A0A5N5SMG0_9CRUS|nr:Mitochondrial sodium/hydrogen exchanger 9B2 [Armadillidium nasatum]